MYFAERQHHRPAMLELKSLHNVLNSMEHTAIYTDSGPRSPKTKYHNQKHLRLTYNETHLTVAMQPTNFHIRQLRAKTSTQQPMQRCSNYNRSDFARRRDCQSNSHTLIGG